MITLKDILDARERIAPYITHTPLIRVPALDKILSCEVYLKLENLQYTGSFKLRGASNRLLALSPEERKRGVVCASSGNHAQGVAYISQCLGIEAVIVMPTNCNPVKLAGVKKLGATAILEGTLSSEREAKAKEYETNEGKTVIPPYNDDFIRAGQGTIGLEILEDEPNIDVVVAPVGGGGLITGIATAITAKSNAKVIAVEPIGAARYSQSRMKKKPIKLDKVDTIADGTRTDYANEMSYNIIEEKVHDIVTTSDDYILKAMKLIVATAKVVVEPSSAMVIAAVLEGTLSFKPQDKVCFVISGGNNDLSLLSKALEINSEEI